MRKLAVFISLNFALSANGQELPKIIQPSPSAMQFQKYGDYPVGHYTGVPEISIPLYTIKEGDIELPISLSYHASGSKPSDPNGYAGMGWSLNCGGMINRTIYDQPDEIKTFPATFSSIADLNNLQNWQRDIILKEWEDNYDTEPDVFFYSFAGHTGKFVLDYTNSQKPLLMPYKPIEITKQLNQSGSPFIQYFNVLDENGFNYRFMSNEFPSNSTGPTGWSMDRLQSPMDASNVVTFTYGKGPVEYRYGRSDIVIGDDNPSSLDIVDHCYPTDGATMTIIPKPVTDFMEYSPPFLNTSNGDVSYNGGVITEVDFRSGKVKFIPNGATGMLARMEIYSSDNTLIKSIDFVYEQRPVDRVLLKEIRLNDKNNQFVNKYSFDYINENIGEIDNDNSVSIDFWGYYNGSATSVMPDWSGYFSPTGSAVIGKNRRESNEVMKTFVLNGITYPTGGKTVFDYEGNKAAFMADYYSDIVGGLRVKTITNYSTTSSTPEVKTYEYPAVGLEVYPGKREDYSYATPVYIITDPQISRWENYRRRYFMSDPFINLTPHGSPVVYTNVTEYIGDGQHNAGKNIYYYSNTQVNDQTDYFTYTNSTPVDDPGEYNFKRFSKPFKDWTCGVLTGVAHFKSDGNGGYAAVSSDDYQYEEISGPTLRAFKKEHFAFYMSSGCDDGYRPDEYDGLVYSLSFRPPQSVYNYVDYYYQSGEYRLTGTSHTEYGDDQQPDLTTSTSLEYANSIHDQPTKKTTTNSKNERIITELKYPHDFAATEPYNTMVNTLHVWSPVIEQNQYKNSTALPLVSLKTNYNSWNNNIIAPATIDKKTGTNSYETRIHFYNYDDKGNVLTVGKESDQKLSYIYDYNKTLPVAECANASSDAIAYTSFEADGSGNWSFSGAATTVTFAPTGRKAYTIQPGLPITKTGLNAGLTYIVSYWTSDGGPFSITGSQQTTQGRTVNGWTNYVHRISGQTGISINGSGLIDELRLYPDGAQMKTYTYDQLIGMTAECDVNNRIIYYEYDDARRLHLIRDQDQKVVKMIDYNYAGQPNNNGNIFYNTAISKIIQRNNCGVNNIPSSVTYYVPADKYTSTLSQDDADAKAMAEVNTTGQNYANSNATCTRIYYNVEKTGTFNRQCADNSGSNVTYVVPAGTYSSILSQDAADALAVNDVNAHGQDYANSKGTCAYYISWPINSDFYSQTCQHNYSPDPIHVAVAEGTYTSTISQNDADNKAYNYAQNYANTNGTCYLSGTDITFQFPDDTHTHWIITFTSSNQQQSFYFEPNGSTSGILGSIPFGTYTVYFENDYDGAFDFNAGCSTGYGTRQVWIDNVTIDQNSCNTISIVSDN